MSENPLTQLALRTRFDSEHQRIDGFEHRPVNRQVIKEQWHGQSVLVKGNLMVSNAFRTITWSGARTSGRATALSSAVPKHWRTAGDQFCQLVFIP